MTEAIEELLDLVDGDEGEAGDDELFLRLDVSSVVAAERAYGRKLSEMLDEMKSESGTSLALLQVLVAAARYRANASVDPVARLLSRANVTYSLNPGSPLDLADASDFIERHGLDASADAVGEAVRDFLGRLGTWGGEG